MERVRYQAKQPDQGNPRSEPVRTTLQVLLVVWFVAVAGYFLWEMVSYRGLYALLSETEFASFGRNFPIANFALLLLVFSLPSVLVLLYLLRNPAKGDDSLAPAEAALLRADRFDRLLRYAATGLSVTALAAAGAALMVAPGFDPDSATREVDVAASTIETGPAVVRGDILFSKSATLSLDAISSGKDFRVVPIVPPGGQGSPLRFFAEYDAAEVPDVAPDEANGRRAGVIQRNRVPPSVLVLYRDAGYEIASPSYLVSRSKTIVSAPYWGLAFMLAIAGLVAWGLSWSHRRHMRRLIEGGSQEAETPPEESQPAVASA